MKQLIVLTPVLDAPLPLYPSKIFYAVATYGIFNWKEEDGEDLCLEISKNVLMHIVFILKPQGLG